jgi:hypothetical protein
VTTPSNAPTQQLACGGLPGKQKPGMGLNIVVTATAIEGLIGILESPLAALAILPIVAGKAYYLQTFCGAPQPADPVLTDQDFRDALDVGNVVASGNAGLRINQWLDYMLWPLMCDCTDGTSPPPVTNTTVPGLGVNPGLPAGPTGANCWAASATFQSASVQTTYFNSLFPRTSDMPDAGYPANQKAQHLPLPLPTSLTASVTTHNMGSTNTLWSWTLQFLDASGAPLGTGSIFSPSLSGDTTYTASANVPASAVGARFFAQGPVPNRTDFSYEPSLTLYCGTQTPTSIATPCCPPDATVDVRLRRIEQLEQVIIKLLGHALVGHVDGTRHSNLSGSGSIVLVDSVDAIRVEVTSDPSGFEVNPGTPNYYFSMGFITSIAAGSPLKGWRLVYLHQTYPIVSYADQIGYTLAPGVHVDIVELLPAAS